MNKVQKSARKTILLTVGKALTLCGVALTFAACYGVMTPPDEPDYWAQKSAEETLLGVGGTKAEASVQTESANRERCAETLAEQVSQNERLAPLQGE